MDDLTKFRLKYGTGQPRQPYSAQGPNNNLTPKWLRDAFWDTQMGKTVDYMQRGGKRFVDNLGVAKDQLDALGNSYADLIKSNPSGPDMAPQRPPVVAQPGSQVATQSPRGPMDQAPRFNTNMSVLNNLAANQQAPEQVPVQKNPGRMAPNQFADKGAKPTPPEDPMRRRMLNFAKAIDTPGMVKDGVYISGAQAYRNNLGTNRSEQSTNKTKEYLEKTLGKEATEAIMANGNFNEIQKYVGEAVKRTGTQKFLGTDANGNQIVEYKDGKPLVRNAQGEVMHGTLNTSGGSKSTALDNTTSNYDNTKAIQTTESVLDQIAEQGDGFWADWTGTGTMIGTIKEKIAPGTPEAQVAADVQTLAAQEIQQSLTNLRKASKDGSSGLGQITAKELDLLRDLRLSLTTFQNKDQLVEKVQELRASKQYFGILERIARDNPNISYEKLQELGLDSFQSYKKRHYKPYGGSGGSTSDGWSVREK